MGSFVIVEGEKSHDESTPKAAKIKNKDKKRKKKKKRPPHKSKMITGYIIYASEIRKDVIKKYPDRDFGDISKLVGIEWKNLPQEIKVAYEKRAQEQNAKSKAIAAEAFELKKLADAAEERAKEQEATAQQATSEQAAVVALPLPTTCNGYIANGHSQPITTNTTMQQQQPLQIIKHQQQPIATTVQYCNNNSNNNCTSSQVDNDDMVSQHPHNPLQSPPQQNQILYQRNNIVYRKPATVRLKPKDSTTQTDTIEWINNEPRKPLRFSQKFIDYLSKDVMRKSFND